jgi:hypothetical protein
MSLIAKAESNSSTFTPVPAGMHLARCFRVVDLGTQKSTYMGKDKFLRKIMLQFEIHSEDAHGNPLLTDKGEPLSIAKRYTLSLAEKATLSLDLESWRGAAFTADERRGFNLEKLLGVWAMLNVTKSVGNDGKEYTNIETINPVPAQIKKAGLPEGHNDTMLYSIDNSSQQVFDKLSEGIKKTIMNSPEWQERMAKKGRDPLDDDFADLDYKNEPF